MLVQFLSLYSYQCDPTFLQKSKMTIIIERELILDGDNTGCPQNSERKLYACIKKDCSTAVEIVGIINLIKIFYIARQQSLVSLRRTPNQEVDIDLYNGTPLIINSHL